MFIFRSSCRCKITALTTVDELETEVLFWIIFWKCLCSFTCKVQHSWLSRCGTCIALFKGDQHLWALANLHRMPHETAAAYLKTPSSHCNKAVFWLFSCLSLYWAWPSTQPISSLEEAVIMWHTVLCWYWEDWETLTIKDLYNKERHSTFNTLTPSGLVMKTLKT